MAPKKRPGRKSHGRKRGPKRGRGLISWIKDKALPFLRKTKLVSTVGNALAPVVPVAGTIAKAASSAGYGRKRRTRRGKGLFNFIKNKALPFLKKTKLISTVGNAVAPVIPAAGTIAKVATAAGYGKRRGRGMHPRRGRGIGHLGVAQSGVGIAGTTTYSQGAVQF